MLCYVRLCLCLPFYNDVGDFDCAKIMWWIFAHAANFVCFFGSLTKNDTNCLDASLSIWSLRLVFSSSHLRASIAWLPLQVLITVLPARLILCSKKLSVDWLINRVGCVDIEILGPIPDKLRCVLLCKTWDWLEVIRLSKSHVYRLISRYLINCIMPQ